jgi:uncharacterized protein (DUF433 family)
MEHFKRISHNTSIMGGKACIAGTRITVGTVLMHISDGVTPDELIIEYPHLTKDDVTEALRYAAWLVGTREEAIVLDCVNV